MLCRQQALTLAAGPQEGLIAWQKLLERYEPSARTRQAGQLMTLLSWRFDGNLLERLELFDRAVGQYQARSEECLSDAMKVGITLRRRGP